MFSAMSRMKSMTSIYTLGETSRHPHLFNFVGEVVVVSSASKNSSESLLLPLFDMSETGSDTQEQDDITLICTGVGKGERVPEARLRSDRSWDDAKMQGKSDRTPHLDSGFRDGRNPQISKTNPIRSHIFNWRITTRRARPIDGSQGREV
ncbi:hypothetical protein AAG570_002670 [Ranatra chinensis]|uniref:Uncharacterized protein n=1 Tax=Ranatra chinensis TaxID=642074 RepID=A0ABD0Y963_9HEMI